MILELLDEAVQTGARLDAACDLLGLSIRTVQRWQTQGGGEDCRHGPKRTPANKLSEVEKREILAVANSPEYRDVSPKQIVPKLADQGTYIASESSFYRTLHEEDMVNHRERSKPASAHRPSEHVATGPWQVASWDISRPPSLAASGTCTWSSTCGAARSSAGRCTTPSAKSCPWNKGGTLAVGTLGTLLFLRRPENRQN